MPTFGFQVSIKRPFRDGPNMAWPTGPLHHEFASVEVTEPKVSICDSKVAISTYQYHCGLLASSFLMGLSIF